MTLLFYTFINASAKQKKLKLQRILITKMPFNRNGLLIRSYFFRLQGIIARKLGILCLPKALLEPQDIRGYDDSGIHLWDYNLRECKTFNYFERENYFIRGLELLNTYE